MSIAVLQPEMFVVIFQKAMDMKLHARSDINKSQILSKMDKDQVEEWVTLLALMNWQCFTNRYKDESYEQSQLNLTYNSNGYSVDTIQFLKYLHCVEYNIETEYLDEILEEDMMSLDILKEVINEIQGKIVSEMEEYKQAQWCLE